MGALIATAAVVGLLHTVTGPDHFVPFVAMSRAGRWSYAKTIGITASCGVAHVASSLVLGLAGILVGTAVAGLVEFEQFRGNVAAWLLFGFGLAYLMWALRQAWLNRPHSHLHAHADGTWHQHEHVHDHEHDHGHSPDQEKSGMGAWILFLVFIFGPCEPLIPLLMYPAAKTNVAATLLVSGVFAATTLSAMLGMVTLGYFGLSRVGGGFLERYAHVGCGAAIVLCGAAMCYGL